MSAIHETVIKRGRADYTLVGQTTPKAGAFTQIRWAKGADVASANALTLGVDGNSFDITGSTAITSIGTLGIGAFVCLHFDGILTLTHHATNLILPGGVDITTAAGDEAMFVEYDTGKWRCLSYSRASGGPVAAGDYKPGGTDVAVVDGGTGASDAATARTNLVVAKSGANTDITSLAGLTTPLSVAQGGTGSATAAGAFTNLKQAASEAATGVVELATDAETLTGTAIDKVTTPANIAAKLASPGALGGTAPGAVNFTALFGKRTASAVDYNPSALTSDYIIAITNTDAARSVVISSEDVASGSATQPRIMQIKDESGGASSKNISVTLENAGTIDGAASFVINQNYMAITLYLNGVAGFVF